MLDEKLRYCTQLNDDFIYLLDILRLDALQAVNAQASQRNTASTSGRSVNKSTSMTGFWYRSIVNPTTVDMSVFRWQTIGYRYTH